MFTTMRMVSTGLGAALLLAACGGGSGAGEGEPVAAGDDLHVVATTSILGDVVGDVVGDSGTVTTLIPPGTDPHAFEASPPQARALREADLVVANGLGLEENLLDALDAAEQEGVAIFEVAAELDPIAYGGDEHADEDGDEHADEEDAHAEEEDEHGHDAEDPHVWFDPTRMADGVELIASELADIDGDGGFDARGEALADELRALDEDLAETLSQVDDERRVLVTNHEALGYLADRYDFEILGAVIPGGSTQAESNPQAFGELAELIRDAGVPAIFAENTESSRLADALGEEVGDEVEVVELFTDALGEEGSGAETYADLMRTNAQLVADALG